jgi:hypothetical protein
MGKFYPVPPDVAGWSWGAFFLSWIWAIGNRTWIGLLALVPYLGLIVAVVLGIKGREWAWQNKRWDSVEHFRRVQRTWSIWGVCLLPVPMLLGIVTAIAIPAYDNYTSKAKLAEAYQFGARATEAVGNYIAANHAIPADVKDAGFAEAFPPVVRQIAIDRASGHVGITIDAGRVSGTFYFAPTNGPDGKPGWRCLHGDVPPQMLPHECRYDTADRLELTTL